MLYIHQHCEKVDLYIVSTGPFTDFPRSERQRANLGHAWYLSELRSTPRAIEGVTKKFWSEVYTTICTKIDEAIEVHHGIPCFFDGYPNPLNPHNQVFLHFCDALVIAMKKQRGESMPNVLIKSTHFSSIPPNIFVEFFDHILTSEEKYFTFFNADMFYHSYGLWGNYSNKPIRVELKEIIGLTRSEVVANDKLYLQHQRGKYNGLFRKCHTPLCKNLYVVD